MTFARQPCPQACAHRFDAGTRGRRSRCSVIPAMLFFSDCCCSPSDAARDLALCCDGVVAASWRPCCRHTRCCQVCRRSRRCSSGIRHEGQGRAAQVRLHPPHILCSPVTRFLPQPPGRCQCRWQGRRRRVQGGVAHSSAAALLRSPFLQADIAAKVKVVEAAAAGVCGLCSYAPLSASCPCAAEVAVVARRL